MKDKKLQSLYGNILMSASIRIELINIEQIPTTYKDKLIKHFETVSFTMDSEKTKNMLDAAAFKLAKRLEDEDLTVQTYTNLLRIIKSVKDARFASQPKKLPYFDNSELVIDGGFALALLGDFAQDDKDTLKDVVIDLDNEEPMFAFNVVLTKEREPHFENVSLAENFFGLGDVRTEFVVDSPLVDNFTLNLA